MHKEITKANVKLQKSRINSKVWTKGDILAFGKMLNSIRFSSKERREDIYLLNRELNYIVNEQDKAYEITKDQSDFGIDWLKKTVFTSKGKLSQSKTVEDFGEREADIIKNFYKFEFVGFNEGYNGNSSYYSPIYRAIGNDGKYFEYTMSQGHWGKPEIVGRGTAKNKLQKVLA